MGLLTPGTVRADSDGYYCIGAGYVAYQFGLTGNHRLHLVRYGSGAISEPVVVPLQQFQVHGMQCRPNGVDIAAFDAIHTVAFDSFGNPVRLTSEPLAPDAARPAWTSETNNLGTYSRAFTTLRPERHALRVDPNGDEYFLEITAAPDSVRECPPIVTARVVAFTSDRRELRARVLYRGNGESSCTRHSVAPIIGLGTAAGNQLDVLLDALVFGPPGPIDVTVYVGALRTEFEQYLRRADAYRTTRPPAAGSEMRMVDAARVRYEQRLAAISRDTGVTALVVAYVDELHPCYEWEGSFECPEREALFADRYQGTRGDGPLAEYLPLLAAHRWLCAAEAYQQANRPADAERARRLSSQRLGLAITSRVLLIRTAAAQLVRRGKCLSPPA